MAASASFTGVGDAAAVMRVESYVEEVLKPDFVLINERRCVAEETIAAFDKLEEEAARYMRIAAENDGEGRTVSTLVDVGCEVYTQAEIDVERNGTMLVSIGYGFYLELPYNEVAGVVAKIRAHHMRRRDEYMRKEAEIKAHIKILTGTLQELELLTNPDAAKS